MKKQLLIAGIICGIICAACVFLYTEMVYAEADSKRSEALERYGGEQVEVVVATRTIHPGETLDPSNCTTKTWLSDLLPDGALMELSEMEGKQATSLILEGEVVSQSRLTTKPKRLVSLQDMWRSRASRRHPGSRWTHQRRKQGRRVCHRSEDHLFGSRS